MDILVCISGWQDADLLKGAVESVKPLGWPVLYCDGAYPPFAETRGTNTIHEALEAMRAAAALTLEPNPHYVIWADEAQKKSAMLESAQRSLQAYFRSDTWVLFLDTDERLEWVVEAPSDVWCWLNELLSPDRYWANLNIYRPDATHTQGLEGFPLPRLLRLQSGLEFRPPRDFDVYLEDERIAFLDGEPVPEEMKGRFVDIPSDVLRIRHDRHLRSPERLEANGHYQRWRREVHGVA